MNAQTSGLADEKIDIHGENSKKKNNLPKIQVLELNGIDIMLTSKKQHPLQQRIF